MTSMNNPFLGALAIALACVVVWGIYFYRLHKSKKNK